MKNREPINIIFMRRVGRLYSTDVSIRFLVLAGVFSVVYLVVSIIAISRWSELSLENRDLRERIAELSIKVDNYQEQTKILTQYQQLMGEMKKNSTDLKPPQETTAQPGDVAAPASDSQDGPVEVAGTDEQTQTQTQIKEPDSSPPQTNHADEKFEQNQAQAQAQAQEPDPQPKPDPKPEPKPEPDLTTIDPPVVDATNLNLSSYNQGKGVKFKYSLKNIHPDNQPVTGYLFMVLENKSKTPHTYYSYPDVEIKNGNPADPKEGTLFSIKHGKTVRGTIGNLPGDEDYDYGWVFAYAEDGELLMKKRLDSQNE